MNELRKKEKEVQKQLEEGGTFFDGALQRSACSQDRSVSAHVLRHIFCAKSISAGMDVKFAQYLMGHSDASITRDLYADTDMDKICESVELLEKRCN